MNMQALKLISLLLIACVLAVIALVLLRVAPRLQPGVPQPIISNFEECAAAGNAVMESYPRQCRTADGRLFVEEIPDGGAAGTFPSQLPGEGLTANGCAVAGCSGQLCVSANEASTIVTTCEYRNEYSCYREPSCEPQANGKCGWTQTASLKQCLANPPQEDVQLEVM
jgi:eight-cysteine-cluster-containing protein